MAEFEAKNNKEIVAVCMGCNPASIGKEKDETGRPYSHGYCKPCAVLKAAEDLQGGLERGEKRRTDRGRRVILVIGQELNDPAYDPTLSELYVPGVSEQRLGEARHAFERAEVTGSIQEFLGRRAA